MIITSILLNPDVHHPKTSMKHLLLIIALLFLGIAPASADDIVRLKCGMLLKLGEPTTWKYMDPNTTLTIMQTAGVIDHRWDSWKIGKKETYKIIENNKRTIIGLRLTTKYPESSSSVATIVINRDNLKFSLKVHGNSKGTMTKEMCDSLKPTPCKVGDGKFGLTTSTGDGEYYRCVRPF